jgi:hypothetical protein
MASTADTTTFAPAVAWEFHTDLTLVGLAMACEAQTLVAWDAGHVLYLLDRDGNLLARWPSEQPLQAAAISDDGQWITALAADGRVFWFDNEGKSANFVRGPTNPLSLAIDPQGWYILTSSTRGDNLVLDRRGRMVSGFRSPRPLRYLMFLQESPFVLGAAEQGYLAAMTIYGRTIWKVLIAASLAGLTADARGTLVITPANQQGLLRFNSKGTGRGAYPFEELPTSASLSAAGDLLLFGTMSQQAVLLRRGKQVLWRQELKSKIVQVQLDALGRSGYLGLESGRIVRVDFQRRAAPGSPATQSAATVRAAPPSEPAWSASLKVMHDQLAGISLKIIDSPTRIGVLLPNQTIAVYDGEARQPEPDPIHVTGVVEGKGRVLLAGEGLLVGLSDRKSVVYDSARNQSVVYATRFTEVTHSRLYSATELILVQERDRLTRATLSGEVAWVEPLRDCVQELAIAGRTIAVVTDRGELIFYTPSGQVLRRIAPQAGALQLLVATNEQFVTAGKGDQMLRAYSPFGELLWERPAPMDPWQLLGVGQRAVLRGLSGETVAVSQKGKLTPGRQPQMVDESYFTLPSRRLARTFSQQGTLCCAAFTGEHIWRHMLRAELGPVTASRSGVAAIIGSRLCWFPSSGR